MTNFQTRFILGIKCPEENVIVAVLFDYPTGKRIDAKLFQESELGQHVYGPFLNWIDEIIDNLKLEYTLVVENLDRDYYRINVNLKLCGHPGLSNLKGNKAKNVIVSDSFYLGASHLEITDKVDQLEKVVFRRLHMQWIYSQCPFEEDKSQIDNLSALLWRLCRVSHRLGNIDRRSFQMRNKSMAIRGREEPTENIDIGEPCIEEDKPRSRFVDMTDRN